MAMNKLILSLPLLVYSLTALSFSNPFAHKRDGKAIYLSQNKLQRAYASLSAQQTRDYYNHIFDNFVFTPLSKAEILKRLQKTKGFKEAYRSCKQKQLLGCRKSLLKKSLVLARNEHIIDDIVYLLLKNHIQYKKKSKRYIPFEISSYHNSLFDIDLERELIQAKNDSQALNGKKYFQRINRFKMTSRQALYLQYSSQEIVLMGQIVSQAIKIMNSVNISINADYDGDGNVDHKIELAYGEKRRYAQKLLRRLVKRALSKKKIRRPPT